MDIIIVNIKVDNKQQDEKIRKYHPTWFSPCLSLPHSSQLCLLLPWRLTYAKTPHEKIHPATYFLGIKSPSKHVFRALPVGKEGISFPIIADDIKPSITKNIKIQQP